MYWKISIILFILCISFLRINAQEVLLQLDAFITDKFVDSLGHEIGCANAPGEPPAIFRAQIANPSAQAVMLENVPAYSWSFGCSSTAAAMAAGYYDNSGYPEMYTGPTNEGIMPMDNTCWGWVTINGETRNQCPLSSTRINLDGRQIRGHVDDFWIVYRNYGPDPYIVNNWDPHNPGDCTGDFMGTNQSALGNADGNTRFFFLPDGNPLFDYTGDEPYRVDGCHGLRRFYESRGYSVVENFTQLVNGLYGNTVGFTFEKYKEEIDNGRPVIIQLAGHSMLGFGYDEPDIVYLHDTWDYETHSLSWGGSYFGMAQWGVSVLRLESETSPPLAEFSVSTQSVLAGQSVDFSDLSLYNPTSWYWTFEGGTPSISEEQNPTVTYTIPGVYKVNLKASNLFGYDTQTKFAYITVSPIQYCLASGTCNSFISNVQMSNIENSSYVCGSDGYTDNTAIAANLVAGERYILMAFISNSLPVAGSCGAWIDWNRDYDFDESGEFYPLTRVGETSFSTLCIPPSDLSQGTTRLRIRTWDSIGLQACGYSSAASESEDYSLECYWSSGFKTLNLFLFIEGLYDPNIGAMKKARGVDGDYFPLSIADLVNIRLVESEVPFRSIVQAKNAPLDQNGMCSILIPDSCAGPYYIVVQHRNSIEVWSSNPISFSDSIANFDFSDQASKAYGNNLNLVGDRFCLISGDINQDGEVDSLDFNTYGYLLQHFSTGYLSEDLNGDGQIDSQDMIILDNNASNRKRRILPGWSSQN